MGIDISFHAEKAVRALQQIPRGAPRALADAINRSIGSGSAAAKAVIPEVYNPTVKVGNRIKSQNASQSRLRGAVRAVGPMTWLDRFTPSPPKGYVRGAYYQRGLPVSARPPISVEVFAGKRKEVRGAFWQRLPNGKVLLLVRRKGVLQKNVGKLRPGQMVGRRPQVYGKKEAVDRLFSVSVAHMLRHPKVEPRVIKAMEQMLTARLDRNINILIANGGKWTP